MRRKFIRAVCVLIIAVFLTVFMVNNASINVYAAVPQSKTDIQTKINELVNTFSGTYFNVDRNTECGSKSSGHGCKYCSTSNIVNATWFKNMFGSVSASQFHSRGQSCFGFAWFAEWYIFRASNSDTIKCKSYGPYTFNQSNIQQHAQVGDYLRLYDTSSSNGHSVVLISFDSTGITVLDSNWSGSYNCLVQKHKIKYSAYNKMEIERCYSSTMSGPLTVPWNYDLITNLNYSGKNYLKGTDFTSDVSELLLSRDTSVTEFSVDSQNKHNGYNSLKIVNYSAGSSGKDLSIFSRTADRFLSGYVGDSKAMTLSFWAKASVDGTKLYNRWGYESTYRSVTLTTSWAKYTIRMDKIVDYDSVMHPYIDRAGTVWITEMQLEDGTTATEFVPETQGIYTKTAQTSGSTYTLPAAPTRTGYTFDGWYSAASGGTQITANTAIKSGHYLVYAHWTPTTVSITSHPNDVYTTSGNLVSFRVEATGGNLTYAWQWRSGSNTGWSYCSDTTTGYNASTLTVSAAAVRDGYQYRCKVTNSAGNTAYSNTATLHILGIKTQPSSVTIDENKNATFSVAASGDNLSYQWQWSPDGGTNWYNSSTTGYDTDTMTVYAKISRNGYKYRCKVTNSIGTVISSAATLTIKPRPTITVQPYSVLVGENKNVTFSVTATGGTLSYQWQWSPDSGTNWYNSSTTGYDTDTITVYTKISRNGYKYRCKVTNAVGTTTSSAATLTIKPKPTISTQPSSVTVNEGKNANFSVTASGNNLSYQWQWSPDGGATWYDSSTTGYNTATMTVYAKISRNGYKYRCKVTNDGGTTISNAAALTIKPKPTITSQPTSVTTGENKNVTFSVAASGNNLSYQWQWSPDGGTTWYDSSTTGYNTDTITVYAKMSRNGYKYRCKVTNTVGTTTSNAASLTIVAKPTITSQPQSVSTGVGTTATFKVTASGSGLTYQWQFSANGGTTWYNCTATAGYNTATLTSNATTAKNGYKYRCVVSNIGGSVTSNTVTLTVLS